MQNWQASAQKGIREVFLTDDIRIFESKRLLTRQRKGRVAFQAKEAIRENAWSGVAYIYGTRKSTHISVKQRMERWAKRPSHRSPGNYFYFTFCFHFCFVVVRKLQEYGQPCMSDHCGCGRSDHHVE